MAALSVSEAAERLGLGTLPEDVRTRYTVWSPFSITRSVRQGVAGFEVMDMRTSRRVRVASKREATAVAKLIEADTYRREDVTA